MFDKNIKIVYYSCLKVGDFMIFGDDYDRTLRLILMNDRKNRYEIAKLISSLPDELISDIRIGINEFNAGILKDEILINKAIKDKDGRTSMYRIKISNGKLLINLCRWINDLEENYEFEMIPLVFDVNHKCLLLDKDMGDTIYIGGFSLISSRLSSFLGNTIVSDYNCIQYELYEDIDSNLMIELSDDRIIDRKVNLDMFFKDIIVEDLNSKKNIRRFVRKRVR